MITSNKLPLMKRSRLRPIIKYDTRNKRYGSLVIMNTLTVTDLKRKLGPINIDYSGVLVSCYSKRREEIKIRNRNVIQNRLQDKTIMLKYKMNYHSFQGLTKLN